jgi:WD40 repeat protein
VFKVWNLTKPGPPIDLPACGDVLDTGNIAFSPDGRRLAATDPAGVCFWDVGTWSLHHRFIQAAPVASALLALAPDGKTMAVNGPDFRTILIDAESGQTLATLTPPRAIAPGWLQFSPDGRRLIVAGWRGLLTLWDLKLVSRNWPRSSWTGAIGHERIRDVRDA